MGMKDLEEARRNVLLRLSLWLKNKGTGACTQEEGLWTSDILWAIDFDATFLYHYRLGSLSVRGEDRAQSMTLRPTRLFLRINNPTYLYAKEKVTSVGEQSSKAGTGTQSTNLLSSFYVQGVDEQK